MENDIVSYIHILVLLFADDTVIVSKSADEFQKCLNQYCMEWKLTMNTNKTKVIVFGTKKRGIRNFNFTIAGNNIEIVDSCKYLGVYFSSNGSFYKARSHLVSQARKAMYLLYKRIYNLHLPIDLQLKLFDHTISPILSYGSEFWSSKILKVFKENYKK